MTPSDDDDIIVQESTSKPSSTLYSYREFVQDDFHILLRTELHGMENKYGKDVSYNAYALNEWNMSRPKASLWRNSLQKNVCDSQSGLRGCRVVVR